MTLVRGIPGDDLWIPRVIALLRRLAHQNATRAVTQQLLPQSVRDLTHAPQGGRRGMSMKRTPHDFSRMNSPRRQGRHEGKEWR